MNQIILYCLIVVIACCLTGMIIGLIKPGLFKFVFKKHAKRKIIIPFFVFFEVVALAGCFLIPSDKKTDNAINIKKSADLSKTLTVASNTTKTEKIDKVEPPSSGPLAYEFVNTYRSPSGGSARYMYYSPELLDDRLIELNDLILAQLRESGKITDQTMAFSIDYFNNKLSASNYFVKISDPKTPKAERLSLISSYTASMVYSKSPKINQLIKMGSATVLISY